jgi:hypothetical protein
MSLTPALDEIEARRIREEIELCGKNRGSHDYVPIEWKNTSEFNRVTRFMCRVCFCNIDVATLLANYRDLSREIPGKA